ncbi:hypothetical protein [Gelidibacter maritimus]|uniref:Uncharacterized protein n=1 Tax=Gelidibacter maritimus TaxID=2761487 RepID=A0A7W2M2I1_9FLAO|nr:hypothetical protein [Gelidibacter maritimus]MBA6151524.1 hypothetical protein [Gelidibacter maritimus]
MKAIKIGLAVIVIGTIAFFVINSLIPTPPPPEPPASENYPSVKLIDDKIDLIKTLPNNEFNKDIYDDIKYLIDDHYKPHPPQHVYGRLGGTQLENDQQKKILSKNLYSAYVNKFLEQAFYVFNNKSWSPADLAFIRSEYQLLQKSPYLENGSPVAIRFLHIKWIFDEYDEVNRFISSCINFSYSDSALRDEFPIDDIRGKLNQVENYRKNGLGNGYLNNCTRLHSELNEIPHTLFNKHNKYLDTKIDMWSGMYEDFNSQKTYTENIYSPLKNQIDSFGNGLYDIPDLPSVASYRLMRKLNDDADRAYINIEKRKK